MKKLLVIGVFAMLFVSCAEVERQKAIQESIDNDVYVEDEHGQRYTIVVIEGCEYYLYDQYRQMGLTKVDCNCVADTSKR